MSDPDNRRELEEMRWTATYYLVLLLIKFDIRSAHGLDDSIDYNIDAYIARMAI